MSDGFDRGPAAEKPPTIAERVGALLRDALTLAPEDLERRPATQRWRTWLCDLLTSPAGDRWISCRRQRREESAAVRQILELCGTGYELSLARMRLATAEFAHVALSAERLSAYQELFDQSERNARDAIAAFKEAAKR